MIAHAVPEMMTVIAADKPGGPDVLRPQTRPVPRPGKGEVLIKVAAAGVNGADLSQRLGRYPMPAGASDIIGLEAAGEIAVLGDGVTGWRVGDRVAALLIGGGYAEYCVASALHCLPVPNSMPTADAAALPEVVMTVWLNVFDIADLRPGETLLVHGGASGIGTMAIQMAKALGSNVLVTAGGPEKCRRCEELGAALAIDYRAEDFVAAVARHTGGAGANVILDMIGGDYMQRNLTALGWRGRLVMIAFKHGPRIELDFSSIQAKQLTITGSRLRPRSVEEKARIIGDVRRTVWPLIEAGTIRPMIDSTFPLREAARAHERVEASRHFGKVLLVT